MKLLRFPNFLRDSSSNRSLYPLLKDDIELINGSNLFSRQYYAENNQDLTSLKPSDLLIHFVLHGGIEGRSPSADFDARWYLDQYQDVAALKINPLIHYLRHGRAEGRLPSKYSEIKLFAEHIRSDAATILDSDQFDYKFYLENYPDVALVGMHPLEHFCVYGWAEGRNPNARFSTAYYLEKHKDVKAAGINPFVHWIKWGRGEKRKIMRREVFPRQLNRAQATPSVLFVSHEASLSGAPMVLIGLMNWLRANTDIQFSILVGMRGPLDPVFDAIAPTFYFEDHSSDNLRENLKSFCGNNVQYIYCNTVVSAVYYKHLSFLNGKLIAHIHELEGVLKLFEEQFQELSRNFSEFIAVSDDVAESVRRRTGEFNSKIHVIPPFIERYDEKRDKSYSIRRENDFIIFGCGAVESRKGFDLFCQVGRKLLDQGCSNIRMVWIGSDRNSDLDARKEIQRWNVSEIVEWMGPQPYPRGFFREGDVFLLTSREDPYPLVCLEAAEWGNPIICFDRRAGGMHTFVGDDAGVIVPYLDVPAMARAVRDLADNAEKRRMLGATAYRRVREWHYVDRVAPRIASFFADIQNSRATTELESYFEQIDRSDIVSFDIFDTLVTRRVSSPAAVFELIEFQHTQTEPGPLSLYNERMSAAGITLGGHGGGVDDVSIDQIYEQMPIFRNAAIEKKAEIEICIPHPIGRKIYDYAKHKRKRIFIASDMYLDQATIESILYKCGYNGWDNLFLSSELGEKKETGRLYRQLLAVAEAFEVQPSGILHIGDNWASDVKTARSFGIKAIRFDPLYDEQTDLVAIKPETRRQLSQKGRLWDAVCMQAFRLWILEHPHLKNDLFSCIGFQLSGPLAAMLAMHVRQIADQRKIIDIFFLARDGRITKDGFDALYADQIKVGKYRSHYIHLSRATVIPATLQNPLSSNDLYFLMEGLHLQQKSLKYFIEKAGLDPQNARVTAKVAQFGMSLDNILTWAERTDLSKLLLSLSSEIYAANSGARRLLQEYLRQRGFLNAQQVLLVDVGWLLNIQSRLVHLIGEIGEGPAVVGSYIGSRDRINKRLDHNCVLFEMGEPKQFSDLVEQNTTLFEVLFSAPEAPAARLIQSGVNGEVTVHFKPVDTATKEFQVAQKLHFGARAFFASFASCLRDFMPDLISRDYIAALFEALVQSRKEEVIAAFSQFDVALGGDHDLENTQSLVSYESDTEYTLRPLSEKFEPIIFKAALPRGGVVVVSSAGLDNGSTRYRALNLARSLSLNGIDASVMHSETDIHVFQTAIAGAQTVIFQRCFAEQGNVGRFLEIAQQYDKRCLFDIDDLIFPDFIGVIGSVAGGEWDVKEALFVSSAYESFIRKTDGCIVSTRGLAEYVSKKFGLETAIFSNRISDDYVVKEIPEQRDNEKIQLAYAAGTRSHKKDFELIEPVLFDLISGNTSIELHVMGTTQVSERLMALPNVFNYPLLPYDEMMKLLQRQDLMLVPLEISPFNDAKSYVKFIECGAVGVPVIASPVYEYAAIIRHGENGWLANSEEEWRKILCEVVSDPAVLGTVGKEAHLTVLREHSTQATTYLEELFRLLSLPTDPAQDAPAVSAYPSEGSRPLVCPLQSDPS